MFVEFWFLIEQFTNVGKRHIGGKHLKLGIFVK